MLKQKISLSSPVFVGRIKKYDSYNRRASYTAPLRKADFKSTPKPLELVVASHVPSSATKAENSLVQKKQKSALKDIKQSGLEKQLYSSVSQHLALRAVTTSGNYHTNSNQISGFIDTVYTNVSAKTSKVQKLLYGIGIAVFIFSAGISVQTLLTNRQAKEQIATLGENITLDDQGVSEGTGVEPSESEVSLSAIQSYKVTDPTYPRFIRIPSLNIFSRVKDLGETPEGAIDAPKNIYDVGWYRGSAKPGSNSGASLLLAHVSGWTAPGAFKNISKLNEGDAVQVERGNGELVNYQVTKVEEYPLDSIDMAKILGTEQAGENDLKLMTCSGKYNKDTKLYDHRMVVYAKRV